ncbi:MULTISPECIES: HGxxPAAW family protein [Janibacter]|uniref:Uncharacterized protein n=1 Tax=Janibacter melonis TaxID=262209 RepID=A0A176QGV4_9MICO|nr:HGxxPAAW family protein [Janibacter melonis]MBD5830386.1 hypothetical protein [Janibacter melonis]MCM3556301.1 hypothetical protein [Janibacter melonis]OAB88910.1 hypothetical protein AWH69_03845 [Janibacter melonis]
MSHAKLSARPTGPHAAEDLGHGYNIATWAAVAVCLVGFTIGTIGVVLLEWWLLVVGLVIAVLSLAVGRVLSLMGFGSYSRGEGDSPEGKDALGIK